MCVPTPFAARAHKADCAFLTPSRRTTSSRDARRLAKSRVALAVPCSPTRAATCGSPTQPASSLCRLFCPSPERAHRQQLPLSRERRCSQSVAAYGSHARLSFSHTIRLGQSGLTEHELQLLCAARRRPRDQGQSTLLDRNEGQVRVDARPRPGSRCQRSPRRGERSLPSPCPLVISSDRPCVLRTVSKKREKVIDDETGEEHGQDERKSKK